MKDARVVSDGAKKMVSRSGPPSHLGRSVRSHGNPNTPRHFTIKGEKGGTDLCCHWQPKSSKGGRRRENAFCPSEGGEERRGREEGGGGNKVGRGTFSYMHQQLTSTGRYNRYRTGRETRAQQVYQAVHRPNNNRKRPSVSHDV